MCKQHPVLLNLYLPGYIKAYGNPADRYLQTLVSKLKDTQGRARIDITLTRCLLAGRVVGDIKPLGNGVSELRIHTDPGYRIYYTLKNQQMMLLLIGGSKTSQSKDIEKAYNLARELQESQ